MKIKPKVASYKSYLRWQSKEFFDGFFTFDCSTPYTRNEYSISQISDSNSWNVYEPFNEKDYE